jgi:uncharacterized membrane protein YsdA (DUF1294 family)/cold shock CspA family protein
MHKQGKVVRWEVDRGFGFIRAPGPGAEVFFHIRDFRGPGAPSEGLAVSFEEIHVGGKGPRAMAVQALGAARTPVTARKAHGAAPRRALPSRAPADPWLPWILLLATGCVGALIWAICLRQLPGYVLAIGVLVNGLTFWCYWLDKYAAQKGAWRTPEKTLHGLSLLGGWPAARIAQQVLRHKSNKARFQETYWTTVVLNIAGLVAMVWPGLLRLPLRF